VAIQPNGSRTPFFCVHGLGGTVYRYRDLVRHLGPDQPFYALQSRALDGAQWPHSQIEEMACDYILQIKSVQPRGPYLLGGWSFGGLVAFEMARQFEAQGEPVALVVALDTVLNDDSTRAPTKLSVKQVVKFARAEGVRAESDRWQRIPEEERLATIVTRLTKAQQTPRRQSLGRADSRIHLYERLRWFHKLALNRYLPQPGTSPVCLCLCSHHSAEKVTLLQRNWSRLTPRLDVEIVPGSHNSMIAEPDVQVLAEKLKARFK